MEALSLHTLPPSCPRPCAAAPRFDRLPEPGTLADFDDLLAEWDAHTLPQLHDFIDLDASGPQVSMGPASSLVSLPDYFARSLPQLYMQSPFGEQGAALLLQIALGPRGDGRGGGEGQASIVGVSSLLSMHVFGDLRVDGLDWERLGTGLAAEGFEVFLADGGPLHITSMHTSPRLPLLIPSEEQRVFSTILKTAMHCCRITSWCASLPLPRRLRLSPTRGVRICAAQDTLAGPISPTGSLGFALAGSFALSFALSFAPLPLDVERLDRLDDLDLLPTDRELPDLQNFDLVSRARHPPRPTLHVSDPHPPHSRSLTHTRHSHPCSFSSHPPSSAISRGTRRRSSLPISEAPMSISLRARSPRASPCLAAHRLRSVGQPAHRLARACAARDFDALPDLDESHGNGALLPVVTAGSLSSLVALDSWRVFRVAASRRRSSRPARRSHAPGQNA